METSLIHLQESFAAWQASSLTKRHSNASLRTQAVKCLDHYSHKEICAAIGISVNSLRSWQKSFKHDQEIINNPSFITMNLDQIKDIDTVSPTQLSLQVSLRSGITIQVNLSSIKSVVALIVELNKEFYPCSI